MSSRFRNVVILIVIILAVLFVLTQLEDNEENTTTGEYNESETKTQPETTDPTDRIKILNCKLKSYMEEQKKIFIRVRNDSYTTVEQVNIGLQFFSQYGDYLGSEHTLIREKLEQGEEGTVETYFETTKTAENVDCECKVTKVYKNSS